MSVTKDFTDLLIRRIRNFHIAEGVSLQQLASISIIVAEYFKVIFDFLINGHSIKVGQEKSPLMIDLMLRNVEDVDLKKDKPLHIPDRIDYVIQVKCYGLFLVRKYNKMDLTQSAKKRLIEQINYKNIKHI